VNDKAKMSPATKAWLGAAFIGAAIGVYAWRGLPSGWDFAWHGGLFLLGLGLMLPQFFPNTVTQVMGTVRMIFGKFTAMP
jgi:hypothetical protein